MLFNSIEFAIFFPVVVALFFLSPQRWRVQLAVGCELLFLHGLHPGLYPDPAQSRFSSTTLRACTSSESKDARRPRCCGCSIVSTCTVLFIFKYYGFFASSFEGLAGLFGWHLPHTVVKIILPIGLSFHTFQSLSYVVEVYRGKQKAEHDFIVYATYVMFFPQLVAGPIERPQNLLHQFRGVA